MFSSAVSSFVKREGEDITGNATAIAEICGTPDEVDRIGLRVGMLFIILVTSLMGTCFPILAKRIPFLRRHVPGAVFEFAKYFGSGVILTTAFMHLLEPAADEELNGNNIYANGGCLPNGWGEYPWAFGICLISLFLIFVMEMFAYRLGTAHLAQLGINLDGDAHHRAKLGQQHEHEIEATPSTGATAVEKAGLKSETSSEIDDEYHDSSEETPVLAQIIGIAVLEFGVVLHSIIIGLTLALSTDEFNTLAVVIVFHQAFEGLGLGSRLAFLKLPAHLNWVPFAGALLYSTCTPVGIAAGLGARSSLSMSSTAASIASGVLDSISAGILIYTALVELIAHEFIFNPYWHTASIGKLCYALSCFALGSSLMALLAKWA